MATVKISQMQEVLANEIDGEEFIPVVKNGVNKKVKISKSGVIYGTYAQILLLKNNSNLKAGVNYFISDRNIFIEAISVNEFALDGVVQQYCPTQYTVGVDGNGNNWQGVYDRALDGTDIPNGLWIWGGKVWNRTPSVTTVLADSDFNLSGPAIGLVDPLTATNGEYALITFGCKYDFANDWIFSQWDDKGNILGCSKTYWLDAGNDASNNPCYHSDWNYAEFRDNIIIGFYNNNLQDEYSYYFNTNKGVIKNNITRNINNNSNEGNISDNVSREINYNSNAGNISGNISDGRVIEYNSNNGDISNNTKQVSSNSNNGGISDNSNTGGVTNNSNNGSIINNSQTGSIDSNSNNGGILNITSPANVRFCKYSRSIDENVATIVGDINGREPKEISVSPYTAEPWDWNNVYREEDTEDMSIIIPFDYPNSYNCTHVSMVGADLVFSAANAFIDIFNADGHTKSNGQYAPVVVYTASSSTGGFGNLFILGGNTKA